MLNSRYDINSIRRRLCCSKFQLDDSETTKYERLSWSQAFSPFSFRTDSPFPRKLLSQSHRRHFKDATIAISAGRRDLALLKHLARASRSASSESARSFWISRYWGDRYASLSLMAENNTENGPFGGDGFCIAPAPMFLLCVPSRVSWLLSALPRRCESLSEARCVLCATCEHWHMHYFMHNARRKLLKYTHVNLVALSTSGEICRVIKARWINRDICVLGGN